MVTTFIFLIVCFVAYANGANDNFKGVASLFGSRTTSYRSALGWATVATLAGSVTALFFAHTLLQRFSGKGLVPEAITTSPGFVLAVAAGAGATVILATWLGFPISTTHSLLGALVGAGFTAVGTQVNLALLGKAFVLPLLISPLLAMAVGAGLYAALRLARLRLGVTKEMCLCIGTERQVVPLPQPPGVLRAQVVPALSVSMDEVDVCTQRYVGGVWGMSLHRLLEGLHFLSAGAVSFARGLNDTPKIAGLLLCATVLDVRWGGLAIAVAMALGGLLHARKVAETMSDKLTAMNSGQGLAANLSTALLVTTASLHGLPVSTTHVSVGALLGMGAVTRQARWKTAFGVATSWLITLPCAAVLAALAYRLWT